MRPEALAVGGYFPTPTHLLPRLSGLISPVVFPPLKTKWETRNHCVAFVDPCAGTGGAIITISNTLLDTTSEDSRSEEIAIFACELEKTRHNTLSTVVNWKRAVHSDAFRLSFAVKENCGASLLFLNPPYDTDRQHGRLEEKFLARFTDVLMVGGLLVYIVPFYALAASARTLATHYESIQCFRFPETDFGFKQVALYAKKRHERLTPDALIFQQSLDWSADPSKIPVLPEAPTPLYSLPLSECYSNPISEWKERIVDTQALCRKFKLWHMTPKRNAPDVQVENFLPASSVADLLLRTYPVATPPRPAHIAAGIASGLFNGARITSPDPNLPPLLVKGVFDREYKTIEEKLNKDGEVKSVVQVQQPKLVITALNLETFRYSTLQSGVEATDATEIEKFSAADLLKHYGDSLMSVMQKQCPVLYDPRRDAASIPLSESLRKLFTAQSHATKAIVKLLGGPGLRVKKRRGKTAILLGEIGCLRGDTPIHDPVTGETCSVAERHQRGESFHVWSRSPDGTPVVAAAMPPMKYPTADMVRVTLGDGRSFVVTPAHRFFCGDDGTWVKASDAHARLQGSGPFPLESISDTCLSIHARDASRWSQTALDSTAGCQPGHRSCGGQLLLAAGIGPTFSPSPSDARAHIRSRSRSDDLVLSVDDSRLHQSALRLARNDFAPSVERRPCEPYRQPRESRSMHESSSCPSSERSSQASIRAHTECELWPDVPVSNVALVSASITPGPDLTHHVVSVEPEASEPYYDFHVPIFNNYWAVGVWHHNSGKSTVSLLAARTCNARRVLVMCPPHLLDGWKEQIEAVTPEAETCFLSDVADLEIAVASTATFQVAILSREAAKLGHSLASAGATCPKCGSLTPPDVDFVKKRTRCEHRPPVPLDDLARATRDLAVRMLPYSRHSGIPTMLDGRFVRRMFAHPATPDFKPTVGELDGVIELLLKKGGADKAIVMALLAAGDAARIAWVARCLLEAQRSHHYSSSYLAHQLLLMLPPDSADQQSIPVEFKPKREYGSKIDLDVEIAKLRDGDSVLYPTWGDTKLSFAWRDGVLTVDRKEAGSLEAMNAAFDAIARLGAWEFGDECDEFLYQSVPEPRRIALAKHIARYYQNAFDFLVIDEGHEYGSDSSAQSFAAHRLSGLKAPTLLMTGSLMNGYAESMFVNMWALSPAFRSEFDRDDKQRYIDRYGYRKRILEDRDEDGEVVEFGSMSDRVTRSERIVGSVPGVLPLFLLQHLLPLAVTLHKLDLALDLPACKLSMHEVACSTEQFKRYTDLKEDLIAAIKRDRFDEEKSGKLFGQLAELPSYLDRATEDVGNVEGGAFEIRYPESLDSELVSSQPGFSRDTVLPKERWMLDQLERELAEGRNAMVFTWHVGLLPRISRLISDTLGVEAPILYADKVGTSKRQAWITKEIVRRGRRVLVTNPVAIQTGLNNLVHFSTELWLESPACNPITYRQAVGRVDRIGQTKETRILYPVYADTLQEAMYDLLMKKVAVSVSTDGLDPESALAAAGLGDDAALTGLSIGKQLWALIGGLDDEAPLRAHTKGRRA